MLNNDILRRLRYALSLTDDQMSEVFALNGCTAAQGQVLAWMKPEDEEGTVACSDTVMADFLDGLILSKRGPRKPGSPPPARDPILTNNAVLKKIRIALTLHEEDMLTILKNGGQPLARGELTALFRKPQHKHYRECGDQVLRKFLRGLTMRLRGTDGDEPEVSEAPEAPEAPEATEESEE
jgi:uncharacterized protein YehS (DUF1456 family)